MHLVQEHIVTVQCSSQPLGKEIQNTLSDLLERDFYPQLETILDQYSDESYTWNIDNLNVELPDISQKEWKKELIDRSLIEIEEYLKNHFYTIQFNKDGEDPEKYGFETQAAHTENLFIEYLKTGILKENSFSGNINEILNTVEVSTAFIQKLFTVFNENKKALVRYYFNVPEYFKEKIKSETVNYSGFDKFFKFIHFFTTQAEFSSVEELESRLKNSGLYSEHKEDYQEASTENERNYKKDMKEDTESVKAQEIHDKYAENSRKEQQKDGNHAAVNEENGESDKHFFDKKSITDQSILLRSSVYIENAGLVIVHPFLPILFKRLNLCDDDNGWAEENSRHKAVLLTQYIVTGQETFFESELVLNKLLCGFSADDVVNTKQKISDEEKESCNDLLTAVTQHWSDLKNTSIAVLRATFLQRLGKLSPASESSYLELRVEEKGVDVLLTRLPWGIGMIQTPWMETYMNVYWI